MASLTRVEGMFVAGEVVIRSQGKLVFSSYLGSVEDGWRGGVLGWAGGK